MEKKQMSKKTAVTALVILIVGAIFIGALLLNKGDGPVMGMILSNRQIVDAEAYSTAAETPDDGVYLVVSNAFNKFQVDYQSAIPGGSDLCATAYFVECPADSAFTATWLRDGELIFEQEGRLETSPYGVISYLLSRDRVTAGNYTFELYDGERTIFSQTFTVE